MSLPRGVPAAISMLINYTIIALGFLIALSVAGFDLNRFAIVLGALGVGIGFGLQNVVNNFISGLILIFERPIQVGDVVELTDLIGNVKRIGIRSSTIRTFDGSEVIVPNANLISNEVINWTLSDKLRRIQINVGTAYGSNPEEVLKILKNILSANPEILDQPEPMILFQEFGDSSLNFNLRFWTAAPETWLRLRSDISVEIFKAFKENNIEIPFPQRDLHLKSADPSILGSISDKKRTSKSDGDDKSKKARDALVRTSKSSVNRKRKSGKSLENVDGFDLDE
jgi:small-conductance mechanosensitive channel